MSHEPSRLSAVSVLESVGRELERAADRGGSNRRRSVRASIAVAAAALLVAATVFTAPGRAVAEQLGELVGIGDEPTQERVPTPAGADYPAVVIGAGEAPGGARFEIVASGPRTGAGEEKAACIGVELPGFDGPEAASCIGGEATQLAETVVDPIALIGSPELSPSRLIVQGLALPEVATVVVQHPSATGAPETATAAFGLLDSELAARIDVDVQAGYFVAFLPEELIPPEVRRAHADQPPAGEPFIRSQASLEATRAALAQIEVVAYDGDGDELARRSLDSDSSAGLLYPPAAPPPALAP